MFATRLVYNYNVLSTLFTYLAPTRMSSWLQRKSLSISDVMSDVILLHFIISNKHSSRYAACLDV